MGYTEEQFYDGFLTRADYYHLKESEIETMDPNIIKGLKCTVVFFETGDEVNRETESDIIAERVYIDKENINEYLKQRRDSN